MTWALVLLSLALSWWPRYKLWKLWQEDKTRFFYKDVPLPVDTDAGYYVLAAQGRTLGHPQNLLSWLLAKFSPSLSIEDLLVTGNKMLLWTAPISAAVINAAFALHGYPVAGAIAALGTTSSGLYLGRTTIGRIDTDQLNVTFLVAILSLIAKMALVPTELEFAAYALPLAAVVFLYDLWFPKPIFLLLFSGMVGVAAAYALGWYALPVGAAFFLVVGWREIKHLKSYARLVWEAYGKKPTPAPGTISAQSTVSELEKIGFVKLLQYTIGEPLLVPFGLLGAFVLAWDNLALFLCMSISYLFAPFALLRGQRFLPYATPALWFSIGLCFESAPVGAFLVMLLGYHASTHKNVVNVPRINAGITHILWSVATIPPGTLVTWWDYGYWVRLWSGHNVVCDPQAPWAPEVNQVAIVLCCQNDLAAHEYALRLVPTGPVYVMVSNDMAGWWPAIWGLAGMSGEPKIEESMFYKLATGTADPKLFRHVVSLDPVAKIYEVLR